MPIRASVGDPHCEIHAKPMSADMQCVRSARRELRIVHGAGIRSAIGPVLTDGMNTIHPQSLPILPGPSETKGNGLIVAGTVRTVCDHLVAVFGQPGSRMAVDAGPRYSVFLPQSRGAVECGELRVTLRAGPFRFGAAVEVRPWSNYRVELTILNGRYGLAGQRGFAYDRIWEHTEEACAPLAFALQEPDLVLGRSHRRPTRSRNRRSRRMAIARASIRGSGRVHPGDRR